MKSTPLLTNQMSLKWNLFFTVNKIIKVVVMVPENRYLVRWDMYAALAAVERPVGDGADDCIWCFLDYGSYDLQIRRNKNMLLDV